MAFCAGAELVAVGRSPGLVSEESAPHLQTLTADTADIQQPSSAETSTLHSGFVSALADPLVSSSQHPGAAQGAARAIVVVDAFAMLQAELAVCKAEMEQRQYGLECSQKEIRELQAALVAADAGLAEALHGATAAAEAREDATCELAALQDVQKFTLAQLQEAVAFNSALKEELDATEGAKKTAYYDALAQNSASLVAARSADILQLEATAAQQEVEAAWAEIDALQV